MANKPDYPLNAKKIAPDGTAVAIRTQFEDDTPGQVTSWLSVSGQGIATWHTTADVKDWADIPESAK